MTENDFQAGKDEGIIIGELKSINQRLDSIDNSFSEFKAGVGVRIEKIEDSESVCKLGVSTEMTEFRGKQKYLIDTVKELIYSRNWVIAIVILAVIGAILKVVIK